MADLTTVSGGAKTGISKLSHAEHQAAINALSKLVSSSGATQGVASVFGGNLRSATQSGGTVHGTGTTHADTFAGGVQSGATPAFVAIGSDTVVAGSAFSGKAESLAARGALRAAPLSADTINVAGATAAGVKTETAHPAKTTAHTITLSDKTTVTLTGVTPHDIVKPH